MTGRFDWNSTDLDEGRFTALANLLALRNDGEPETAYLWGGANGYLLGNDGSMSGSDSVERDEKLLQDHDELKRLFLDCLAELVSNERDARPATCTSMIETDQTATIWVTRIGGFKERDRLFLDRLAGLLGCLSSGDGDKETAKELWKAMLAFYDGQIERRYIPQLRVSLEECKADFRVDANERFSEACQKIQSLQKLIFVNSKPHLRLIERHNVLLLSAYALQVDDSVDWLLRDSAGANARTKKLWVKIRMLAKLRGTFHVFENICRTIASFKVTTIVPVPYDEAMERLIQKPFSLEQTLGFLGKPLDISTIARLTGRKWTVHKAREQFSLFQKQIPKVHAETQMALHFSKHGRAIADIFPYFGCSQPSCFLCWRFLQAYSKVSTRGYRFRPFQPWSVSVVTELAPGSAQRISSALRILENDILKVLKFGFKEEPPPLGAAFARRTTSMDNYTGQDESGPKKIFLQSEQAKVAEMFKRLSLESGTTPSQSVNKIPSSESADYEEPLQECYGCPRLTTRRCSACNRDNYCSIECEEERSESHLFICTKRSLSSAHYLFQSIIADTIPENPEVLMKFGFNHFPSFADKCKLLGLYKSLYLLGVHVEALNKWQVEGSLIENIKRHFFAVPKESRGVYFLWFLNNLDMLQKLLTKEEADEKFAWTFFDKAKLYLEKEDQFKNPSDLLPKAKRESYLLLALACHMVGPEPTQKAWYAFGFCACQNEEEEGVLGGLYHRLLLGDRLFEDVQVHGVRHSPQLQTATFSEFWHAYESGKLIELMDEKGLAAERKSLPFLEAFLSMPLDYPHPSIWPLKQILAINDPAEFPPTKAVAVDYGFINCQNFEETCVLMEIYKRLLMKADPLDVHRACLEGNLFEFAAQYDKMDPKHRRLMENVNPLA